MKYRTPALCALIALIAFVGDLLESKTTNAWRLAVIDNTTHGLIAAVSWLAIVINDGLSSSKIAQQSAFCGVLGSVLDIDHFISAFSLRLSDAVQLKSRPFLHNTTLLLLTSVFFFILGKQFSGAWSFGWMLLTAGVSHHIRDATRRGLWLWPLGSTPPIPYSFYLLLLSILPVVFQRILGWFGKSGYSSDIESLLFTV